MSQPSPSDLLQGRLLVVIPHMDDEVLACGGTLAALPNKNDVALAYVTSGRGSENLRMPGVRVDPRHDMGLIRKNESLAAIRDLGLKTDNARFLDIPDYQVHRRRQDVASALAAILNEFHPDVVLAPFRYDRHTDHVALHHIVRHLLAHSPASPRLIEYFVYYRWRMLPRRDIRAHCRSEYLLTMDIARHAALKRAALNRFQSQTTLFFPWQIKPVLSPELLDEVSRGPECFLHAPLSLPDARLFNIHLAWIRVVHVLEPFLKARKEQIAFILRRLARPTTTLNA